MNCIFMKHIITACIVTAFIAVYLIIVGCDKRKKTDMVDDSAEKVQIDSIAKTQMWECGDSGGNVIAMLNDSGTLIVRGIGAMADYTKDNERFVPWHNFKDSIAKVVIEYGVTTIGNRAFLRHMGLMSVSISNSVKSIGEDAFISCSNLTSVVIPNSVKSIGMAAFANTGLKSVMIPDSVKYIPHSLFVNCEKLTSVTIPDDATIIGAFAFTDCINLTSITIPKKVREIGMDAFDNCTGLMSIIVQNPIPPYLEKGAFWNTDIDTHESKWSSACLYVSANRIVAYRAAEGWKNFKCIKDIASAPKEGQK